MKNESIFITFPTPHHLFPFQNLLIFSSSPGINTIKANITTAIALVIRKGMTAPVSTTITIQQTIIARSFITRSFKN